MEVAVVDCQGSHEVGVQAVTDRPQAWRHPVIGKFAVVDSKGSDIAGQYTHFIVEKSIIVQDEIPGLLSDTRTVVIGHQRSGKRKIVDSNVSVGDEYAFAVRDQAGRGHFDPATDAG